jgi:CheY-like chemotaxis protein
VRTGNLTNRKRVLLAEDNEALRDLFTEALSGEGIDVVAVGDGLDAFEAFLNQGPFDAMVTDCDLPRLTGPELVARLRDQPSDVPAVLMSGRLELDVAARERLRVGPTLQKPFRLDVLTRALRRVLAGLRA